MIRDSESHTIDIHLSEREKKETFSFHENFGLTWKAYKMNVVLQYFAVGLSIYREKTPIWIFVRITNDFNFIFLWYFLLLDKIIRKSVFSCKSNTSSKYSPQGESNLTFSYHYLHSFNLIAILFWIYTFNLLLFLTQWWPSIIYILRFLLINLFKQTNPIDEFV